MLYRGSFVSDARGSLGGITASRNRGGSYLRRRVKPTQVPTDPRSRARADLGGQASAWSSLTDDARAAWDDRATTWTAVNRIGETIKLSGFNWYCRTNSLRALTGQAEVVVPFDDIPTTILHPPTSGALDASSQSLAADVDSTDPWAGDAGGRLNVFITRGQNPGRISPSGGFTFVASFPGNGTPVTGIATSSLPVVITTGRVYFVRFVALDAEGRVSADVIQRIVGTP